MAMIALLTVKAKSPEELLRAATPETPALVSQMGSGLTRTQALAASKHLNRFIVGDSGVASLASGQTRLMDSALVLRLKQWLESPNESRLLWIYGRAESGLESTVRDASLVIIATAFQAKEPFISHICERPHQNDLGAEQTADKSGLLGTVYSLIYQLLEFDVQNQELPLSAGALEKLDGSIDSWSHSLDLLRVLLEATPHLRYCIVHGLNALEWADGTDWCSQLVEILLQHQKKNDVTLSVLFTTAGQSRVLTKIPFEFRYESTRTVRYASTKGDHLMLSPPHEENEHGSQRASQ